MLISLIVGFASAGYLAVLYIQLGVLQATIGTLGLAIIPYLIWKFGSGAKRI